MLKNSKQILDRGLDASQRRQQRVKVLTAVAFVSFLLSGCLVIPIEISPRPTQQETPTGSQAPDTTAQQ